MCYLSIGNVDAQETPTVSSNVKSVPYPRIAMLWSPVRDDGSLESYARHDLIMMSRSRLGLKPNATPTGLATGFTDESVGVTRQRIAGIRKLNPDVVLLTDLLFYEYPEEWLPEDHPWWLRENGKRLQFWPGTYRMDWNQADYRTKVIQQTLALKEVGVDGIFYDNLRSEPEPWIAFLSSLREAIGNDFLILANAGYAIDEYDFAAPYVNGIMYESGWSHERTEWDDVIKKLRHTQSLLREPRISLIERFEETRSRAGWPGDPIRIRTPKRDPSARRWSLCFSLIIGDFYYLFSDNTGGHRHDWYPEYDVKIGKPIAEGERLSSHAWKRSFERAEVYVNLPGATESLRVELPFEARDSMTGQAGHVFDIPSGEGRVLVRDRRIRK
jgi:hypothetical protein